MNPIVLAFLIVVLASCTRDAPETPVRNGYDQQEMDAAIAKARSEVDAFIQALTTGQGTDFSVKATIADGDKVEHFWLTNVVYSDGKFAGLIGNDPDFVMNVTFGDRITLDKNEISDWLFMRDGKMHGNYTLRPMLATMPKEQAAQYRAMFASP